MHIHSRRLSIVASNKIKYLVQRLISRFVVDEYHTLHTSAAVIVVFVDCHLYNDITWVSETDKNSLSQHYHDIAPEHVGYVDYEIVVVVFNPLPQWILV